VVQDPMQLHHRSGRASGPHQLAIELVELPRPEPGQPHLADVGNGGRRMSSSYLIQIRGPTDGSMLRSQARRNGSTVVRSSPKTWPSRCALRATASFWPFQGR
jgi:hypothetical protein